MVGAQATQAIALWICSVVRQSATAKCGSPKTGAISIVQITNGQK